MPRQDDRPPLTRGVVLRTAIFTLAIALSAVAVWLVVSSADAGPNSVRRVQIGVLAGLWAAMLGAFAMFGTRRLHPADPHTVVAAGGNELVLHSQRTELERAEEVAARRAHEARLEQLLRREIQTSVAREVDGLRAEIAQLRGDLLEKVGGQLRLERIETTRVIGSDLEALQHELRELKYAAQDSGELRIAGRPVEPTPVRQVVEAARIRPVSRETVEIEADVQPAVTSRPVREPERSAPPAPPAPPLVRADLPTPPPPMPAPPRPDVTGPIRMTPAPNASAPYSSVAPYPAASVAPYPAAAAPTGAESRPQPPAPPTLPPPRVVPAPTPSPPTSPQTQPALEHDDGFAALPRIRPFTDFELDPVADEPTYTGRRRRIEEAAANGGRHAQPADPAPDAGDDLAGSRRRRADENGSDLLARLLAREGD